MQKIATAAIIKPANPIKYPYYNTNTSASSKNKNTLRQLWNEDIEFGRNGIDNEENDSIEHCHSADYKYKSYFAFGQNYNFAQNDTGTLNIYNAVSI